MNVEFLATVAVIAPDPPASRKLYVDALGLPLESHGDDYHHSEQIDGCKSFGIWPLSQAAEAANSGPGPGPEYIRPELTSGGNSPKSSTRTPRQQAKIASAPSAAAWKRRRPALS